MLLPCALRPQGFSPSRRLLPATHLVALFRATTTSGVLSPGVFPPEQPQPPFSSRLPSCRCRGPPTQARKPERQRGPDPTSGC
jgi:hypothetical protein